MSQLAAAATNDASAAEHALTALTAIQTSSAEASSSSGVVGSLQAGWTAGSKVLRNSGTFDGSDPRGQMFSTRLVAILTSYLKGRCLHLVRSGNDKRDEFHLYGKNSIESISQVQEQEAWP